MCDENMYHKCGRNLKLKWEIFLGDKREKGKKRDEWWDIYRHEKENSKKIEKRKYLQNFFFLGWKIYIL